MDFYSHKSVVTNKMYESLKLALRLGRVAGMCPFGVATNRSNYKLVYWSWKMAIFNIISIGYVVISSTIFFTKVPLSANPFFNRKSPFLTAIYAIYNVFFITANILTVAYTPFVFKHLCHFLNHLNRINELLVQHPYHDFHKNFHPIVPFAIGLETVPYILNGFICGGTEGPKKLCLCLIKWLDIYAAMYCPALIVLTFYLLVRYLRSRISALNTCLLDVAYTKAVPSYISERHRKVVNLIRIYTEIVKANVAVDNYFGGYSLIVIFGCLCRILLGLFELSENTSNIYLEISVLVRILHHGLRLILLVQPCGGCKSEIKRTSNIVCKLLVLEQDEAVKTELKILATQLQYSPMEFTAAGLAVIDRSLWISVAGAITTNVVVLFQYRSS